MISLILSLTRYSEKEKILPGLIKNVIAVTFLLTTSLAMAGDGPSIEFDKLRHDYGSIRYGETVTAEFPFVNNGNQTLIIKNLHSTCGCAKAVEGSREIPPKGSSKIMASFETDGLKAGRKEKSIMVSTNDPVNPVVKLTLVADVIRELAIDPLTLGKKVSVNAETVSFPIKIANSSDKTYHVTGLKTLAGELSAIMNPAMLEIGPHREASLEVVVKLDPEPDRAFYAGKIDLVTDHPQESDTELKYLIQVEKKK